MWLNLLSKGLSGYGHFKIIVTSWKKGTVVKLSREKSNLKAERSTVPAIICPVYEGVLIKLQMYHKKLNVALIFSILITNLYLMAEKTPLYPLVDQMANL